MDGREGASQALRGASAAAVIVFVGLTIGSCNQVRAAPFPEVNREKLQISLTRSACYGSCPDYKVTIEGNGRVTFSTREDSLPGAAEVHREFNPFPYVVAPGKHVYSIDPTTIEALVDEFKKANFFGLRDDYSAQITDSATYAVEIDTGNGRKQVVDYVGKQAGMPSAVTDLEDAVDRAAHTSRWVDGADGLIDALASEGFNFHSDAAAKMLVLAIDKGGDQTLLELVRRGAPLDAPISRGPYGATGNYGSVALLTSIREGRAPLFAELVQRGWLKRTSAQQVADAFVESGAGCSPQLVDAAVNAGIPVDITSTHGNDEFGSDGGETALSSLGQSYSCDDESRQLETARRLLARGADPNHRDDAGKTALFGVENLEFLNLLLASGADPRIVDKAGASAIFDTWTDDIVLRLLQAGASPKGRFYDGKSLWDQMKERPMPKVKAWLANHPVKLSDARS